MDWSVIWTGAGVIVSLGALIIGCFRSLSSDIKTVDRKLSRIEGAICGARRMGVKQEVADERKG